MRAMDLKVDTPYTYADIEPTSTLITFADNKINYCKNRSDCWRRYGLW